MKSDARRKGKPGAISMRLPLLEQGRNPLLIEVAPEDLDLANWCRPVALLTVEGSADRFGETVTVRGHVRGTIEETCGRCARLFERPLEVEFLVFSDQRGTDSPGDAAELERDGDLVYHDGVMLDITGAVREAVVLSMPVSPLCREECKGLCASCGADLNLESCGCSKEARDPRWETLKKLKDL